MRKTINIRFYICDGDNIPFWWGKSKSKKRGLARVNRAIEMELQIGSH